jgi:hypothetical protein
LPFKQTERSLPWLEDRKRRSEVYLHNLFYRVGGLTVFFFCIVLIPGGAAFGDNSRFYGTYDMRLSGTGPSPWKEEKKLTIGGAEERMSEESYLHIPPSGSPVTNAWTKKDGAPVVQVITISGDTLMLDEREDCVDEHSDRFLCYTEILRFAFSEDQEGADITGSMWGDDQLENQGTVTGRLTRTKDEGGGGGGCFVATGTAEFEPAWEQVIR